MSNLKCKYCNWQTVKWYKNKKGQLSTIEKAFARLDNHVEFAHPEIYKKIEKGREELYETHP